MGPNKIYELIVTIINALGVAFTDTDKQALHTVLPFVINTDNGYANNCSMNSIYKYMMQMLDISRSAAESRLRRALKRLQDNVDRQTYQNIFMRKENVGQDDITRMSQHDLLYCVVEYVVDEIQKEIGGPAKNEGSCDCECSEVGEPDRNPSEEVKEGGQEGCCCEEAQESPCTHDCHCQSGCCECTCTEEEATEHSEPVEEPVVCHTRYPFEDGDGITKKGIISHILSQFELPFICHTKEIVIECLMCLIGDQGEVTNFTYFGINPDFTFMDKVSLFFDILSFEMDLFDGLTKEELYQYFGKKTKFILMKPSRFMFSLANVISRKYINQLIQEGKY